MRMISCLILSLATALAGCTVEPSDNTVAAGNEAGATPPEATGPPAVPTVAPPLSRRDLLLAAAEAASDYSAGTEDMERQRSLDGRPFSVALRFCEGDGGSRLFKSSFDEEDGVLRLEVRPDLDARALEGMGFDPSSFEAVEGFWVRRPWLLDAACPAPAPVPEGPPAETPEETEEAPEPVTEAAAPPSTIGIAQFFDETSSRSQRRGNRPYEITRKLPKGQGPGPVDLLIEGRVRALPGGRTIVCSGRSPTAAPTCIVSVRIDQVSLRQPGGETLATWGPA